MKKLFGSFFVTLCAVTAANAGKIYWVSPSENSFPGWQGVATADKTFTALKAALTDGDLADGDTVVLDRCEFAMTQAMWSGDNAGWEIKKSITLTGVGTREETIVSTDTNATRSAEVVGRAWGNRFFPYFSLKAKGIKFQNMTFERLGADQQSVISVANNFTGCVISNLVIRNTGWGYYSNPEKSLEKQPSMIGCGNQNIVISGCVITNNCWAGTFIDMGGANSVLENCHIADNTYSGIGASRNLGLVYLGGNYTKIRNNTIINNRTTGGAFNNNNSNSDVANNIIRGNTLLDGTTMKNFWSIGTLSKYVYNCLESDGSTVTGTGNIFAAPFFKEDNFNLRASSPCKGAGSKAYAPAIDIDGTARLDPPTIGCKEITAPDPSFTVTIHVSAESVTESETITFSTTVAGEYEGELSYAWDFNGDGTVDSTEPKPVVSKVDSYNPLVMVSDESGAEKSATYANQVIIYPANKIFYATPANVNARAPYATWETAGTFTDVHTLASKVAGATIVMDEGIFTVRETGYEIGNGMKVTSKSGRDKTIVTTTGRIQGSKLFKLTDANSFVESVTLTYKKGDAWTTGAAIYVTAGTVRDCQVTNFFNKGTMIELVGTSDHPARLERTIIKNCSYNGAGNACAVSVANYGYAVIENCLIAGNVCPNATGNQPVSAIYTSAASSSTIIRNCTIVNNRGTDSAPPFKFMVKPTLFENNIVAGNTTNGTDFACNDVTYYYYQYLKTDVEGFVRNCSVYPADPNRDYSAVTNLLTVAPGFVDQANGDYHLTVTSPCRNKGVNDGVYTSASLDLDGNRRLVGRGLDMGCYECQKIPGLSLVIR